MCLRSGCILNKLRFGEKVQNKPVGRRCQGLQKKARRKASRKLNRCRRLSNFLEGIKETLGGGGGLLVLKKKARSQIGHLFHVIVRLCYMFLWGLSVF